MYAIQIFELLTANYNLFHGVEIITLRIGEFVILFIIFEAVATCCIDRGLIQAGLGGAGPKCSALGFLYLLFCDVS